MSRVKWVLVVALVLCGSPLLASEAAPAPNPFEPRIVPAVLHLPGPGEEPLYSSIQFAKAGQARFCQKSGRCGNCCIWESRMPRPSAAPPPGSGST